MTKIGVKSAVTCELRDCLFCFYFSLLFKEKRKKEKEYLENVHRITGKGNRLHLE